MAALAKGRLREKREELTRALDGRIAPHQRFLLVEQLSHIDTLEEAIERVSAAIATRMEPCAAQLAALDTIPGVSQRAAEILIADAAQRAPVTEMAQFPIVHHVASWAGMCPGNNESAGKRKSGKPRTGNPWLRSIQVEAARAAAHTQGTYLSAQYHRLARRRGSKRAAVAVGHTILVIAYRLLKGGTTYRSGRWSVAWCGCWKDSDTRYHWHRLRRNGAIFRAPPRFLALPRPALPAPDWISTIGIC
jgi:transposase